VSIASIPSATNMERAQVDFPIEFSARMTTSPSGKFKVVP